MAREDEGYVTGSPLELGDVLATTFRTIGASAGTCFGLSATIVIPNVILGWLVQVAQYEMIQRAVARGGDPREAFAALGLFGFGSIAVAIVSFLLTVWFQGALTWVVVERVRGRTLRAGEALRATLPRYLSLLGTSILFYLAFGIGMFLCAAPGILAWVWLVAATPAATCEPIGPIDALGRSIDLTEGSRLTIFALWLVLAVGLVSLGACIFTPMAYSMITNPDQDALQNPLAPVQLVTTALSGITQLGTTVLLAALPAVIYARLRGLRDDVDARSVAEVFA